jgi:hypothetical protein
MITKEKFFENPFNSEEIIPSRLYNFSTDVIGKFIAANTGKHLRHYYSKLNTNQRCIWQRNWRGEKYIGCAKEQHFYCG